MEKRDTRSTEQAILEAAEALFLEKGFAGAKTTEIAKRAGVNHAMIHYYYRTKEDLFNLVFQQKSYMIASFFLTRLEAGADFFEKIKLFTEAHFDFLRENPKLFTFVYTEIVNNEDRVFLIEKVKPRLISVFSKFGEHLEAEFKNGTIIDISPLDLLQNIITMNISSFLSAPIVQRFGSIDDLNTFFNKRKESNVKFILSALRK